MVQPLIVDKVSQFHASIILRLEKSFDDHFANVHEQLVILIVAVEMEMPVDVVWLQLFHLTEIKHQLAQLLFLVSCYVVFEKDIYRCFQNAILVAVLIKYIIFANHCSIQMR